MINRGGEKVYSLEVENALAGAPGVGEIAVIAVPDEMMGEKVGAVIVPAPGAQIDVDAVVAHGRTHLADFKVPQCVAVREKPLPRNPNGKVLKARLREQTDWRKAGALAAPVKRPRTSPWSQRSIGRTSKLHRADCSLSPKKATYVSC